MAPVAFFINVDQVLIVCALPYVAIFGSMPKAHGISFDIVRLAPGTFPCRFGQAICGILHCSIANALVPDVVGALHHGICAGQDTAYAGSVVQNSSVAPVVILINVDQVCIDLPPAHGAFRSRMAPGKRVFFDVRGDLPLIFASKILANKADLTGRNITGGVGIGLCIESVRLRVRHGLYAPNAILVAVPKAAFDFCKLVHKLFKIGSLAKTPRRHIRANLG